MNQPTDAQGAGSAARGGKRCWSCNRESIAPTRNRENERTCEHCSARIDYPGQDPLGGPPRTGLRALPGFPGCLARVLIFVFSLLLVIVALSLLAAFLLYLFPALASPADATRKSRSLTG